MSHGFITHTKLQYSIYVLPCVYSSSLFLSIRLLSQFAEYFVAFLVGFCHFSGFWRQECGLARMFGGSR